MGLSKILKIAKSTWESMFLTRNDDAVAQFYQTIAHSSIHWTALSVNFNNNSEHLLNKALEIHSSSDSYGLKIEESDSVFLHSLSKNKTFLAKARAHESSHLLQEFNSLVERIIEKEIYHFQSGFIIDPAKTFSASEVSNEDKALEWIKASFILLEKAIIESLTNPELLFQTTLFIGMNPKSLLHEIRIILFNLDIQFVLKPDGMLRVKIYNDKNADFGTEKKPSLQGDFDYRKREMLDELTLLLSKMLPGIKLHCI